MGRWGMRLFEGDQDFDTVCEVEGTFIDDETVGRLDFTDTLMDTKKIEPMRIRLDADGLGDKLMAYWRAKAADSYYKYKFIIAGALMMAAGAKITDSDLAHLRDLASQVGCRPGYASPLCDNGFRGPGKAQFLAALDHYEAGTPRSYGDPSCFYCGQVRADTGKTPRGCARCRFATYCDKDCQKAHWKAHKPTCIDPEKCMSLNV